MVSYDAPWRADWRLGFVLGPGDGREPKPKRGRYHPASDLVATVLPYTMSDAPMDANSDLPLTDADRDRFAAMKKKFEAEGKVPPSFAPNSGTLPAGFIRKSSGTAPVASHRNPDIESYTVSQSMPFSCAIASLACALQLPSELSAFQVMCEALPSFVVPAHPEGKPVPKMGTAQQQLERLTAQGFNSSESSLWVPSVLDVHNFKLSVEQAQCGSYGYGRFGNVTTTYAFGAQLENVENWAPRVCSPEVVHDTPKPLMNPA